MSIQLFTKLTLKFTKPNWRQNPELSLIDTVLESRPDLYLILKDDIVGFEKLNQFGRQDTPTVEQIVRAAIFKEIRGLNYRDLEFAQEDSRICEHFLGVDPLRPYSFQVWHKYISRIKASSLSKFLIELNKIAITEGFEDVSKLVQDSTVIETNIHYPTNNSLVWDCIKESHRLLEALKKELPDLEFKDYRKGAKKTYFKINNTKGVDQRVKLFQKQINTFTQTLNQFSNAIKKKSGSLTALAIQTSMECILPVMEQVYEMTYKKEVMGIKLENEEKIFSIYEQHTDIIVKGSRDVSFGHKVNLAGGKSRLILDCEILRGNPQDSTLFKDCLERVIDNFGIEPRDSAGDGGYASKANIEAAKTLGVVNIVFNKARGTMQNVVSSKNMNTRLKKWRSNAESMISNLKRGFNIARCVWKGWEHYCAKVLWSVIGYNIRVMSCLTVAQMHGL